MYLAAPEFQAGPSEHYKGDRFSKEIIPGRDPYEKNYTRGWAVVDVPEEMADVIDEIQLEVDRKLLERLRLRRESDSPPMDKA